jgi:hypothetical protein
MMPQKILEAIREAKDALGLMDLSPSFTTTSASERVLQGRRTPRPTSDSQPQPNHGHGPHLGGRGQCQGFQMG